MAATDMRSWTMFCEATAQIVSQKLDILLHHQVCVGCLSMQTRVKEAKAKLARILEFFSTQYTPSKITEWAGLLLRAMYDAEEFIDKFHLREARERHKALHMAARPLAMLVSKYRLWRDLSILVNKMERLCDDMFLKEEAESKIKKKPGGFSSHASVPWQGKKFGRLTSFWDRQAPANFSCRKAQKYNIMQWIKAEGYSELSIWGEQGTGKTFLARWASSQAKYLGYQWRAWVHVSPDMERREFLLEILKQGENLASDVMDMDMDIEELKSKLYQKLAEINKYFIVLDDVKPSDMKLLLELSACTRAPSQGHIITTSQYMETARFMSVRTWPIKLTKLDYEESGRMLAWNLHGVPDCQTLSREEEDILNMCPGLPLCISLLSGFLSNAGEHDCAALARVDSMMTFSDILELSCHKLPVHLKPCFISMALFPIGFPIPTRRLVRLWLAEGLLDSHCYDIESERTSTPEDVGETFILELAVRQVIDVVSWRANGSPKTCHMITSLYDVIRPTAMSTRFLQIHATTTSWQQELPGQLRGKIKIRWLAVYTNIFPERRGGWYPNLRLSHVRLLLSFYLRRGLLTRDIGTFLRKITSETDYSLLRVLDLEGVYKPSLQGVLHNLVLLRYLGLRSTMLDSLPRAIADLHNLETLDIKHTSITLLPSSFWKARNLRHLHLNWFYIDFKNILEACRNDVMALAQLQTLSRLVIGEVKENFMTDHMNILTTLTTLKLFLQRSVGDTLGNARKAVADWISFSLTNLQSLTFGVVQEAEPAKEDKPTKKKAKPATSPIGLLPKLLLAKQHHDLLELYLLGQLDKPIWTELLPGSLRVLTLSGSKVKTDMMPMLGNLLRNLRTFRLLANSFRGERMMFIKDGFPSLMNLKIWKLPCLQEVIIKQGAMPHLRELEFRHLERLKVVEGINECKELENINVISQSNASVDQFKGGIGKETNLHIEKDTKRPRSTDDGRDEIGEMMTYSYIENNGERPEPTSNDEDISDDDDKQPASP